MSTRRPSNLPLNREVAIKILQAAFSSDLDRLSRFMQEARAVAALNHPNITALSRAVHAES